jgi:hypothetical protein
MREKRKRGGEFFMEKTAPLPLHQASAYAFGYPSVPSRGSRAPPSHRHPRRLRLRLQ